MALNDLFKSKSLIAVESLKSLIFDFKGRITRATSEKERVSIESQFIEYLNKTLDLEIDVNKVSPFKKATASNIISNKIDMKYNVLANTGQIDALSYYYLENVNYMNKLIEEIDGKIRRIEQKRSVLFDWNDINIKYLLKENFKSLEGIGFELSKEKPMSIDVYQGIATLPIKTSERVNIDKISIRNGNGFSGNSNSAVTNNNMNLANILDEDSNTWYEYEKLNDGPVKLTIRCNFSSERIMNEFILVPYFDESSGGYSIKNIVFVDNFGKRKSLRNLITYEIDEDFFFLNNNSNYWGCKFLPVKASTVVIEFESNFYERSEDLRKRYSIGIRNLIFNSNKYLSSGFINSNAKKLIKGLNVVLPRVNHYPLKSNLFFYKLGYSMDEGVNWNTLDTSKKEDNNESLVDDNSSLIWKLNVEREDENFEVYSSFDGEEEFEYKNIQKTFSKNKGIKEILIKEKIIDDDIFAVEKGFINKSLDKKKSITIHRANNRKFLLSDDSIASEEDYYEIPLPINIYSSNLEKEDIQIYVNFKEYTQVEGLEDVKNNLKSFCFSDDGDFIYLSSDIPARSNIKWKMDPEEISPEEGENYFYCRFESLFDSEKSNIKLYAVSSERKPKTLKLNLSKTFHKISEGYVYESSIKVRRSDGTFLEAAEKVSELDEDKYYFNSENNIINIKGNRKKETLTVYFEHKERKRINEKDYEIWYEKNTLSGVKINKNLVGVEEIEEDLSSKRKVFSQKKKKEIEVENLFTSNSKFYIGRKGLIKNSLKIVSNLKINEIEFIDGESEFLNLTKVESEFTNEMNSSSSGLVEFYIAGGKKWWKNTGIDFKNKEVFVNEVSSESNISSTGDWYVDVNGKVSLKQDSIPEGISYSYYYVDKPELKEKFSVDYKNGFLYFSKDLVFESDLKVKYKVLDIIADYSVCKRVPSIESNNNMLKINTDLLYNKVSDVRVFYKKVTDEESLKNYKEYFSPLVYSIDFRFK